jgi:hypothetical protein
MAFKPTDEQVDALDLFRGGQSLAIEAGAGTGKTATLVLLGQDALAGNRGLGQYIAFNKAIVTEAGEKMPTNVRANTAHSLAFREVGRRFAHRLKSGRMRSLDIANRLGIYPLKMTVKVERVVDGVRKVETESKTLSESYLAGVAVQTVVRFCQSADPVLTERHVPYVNGIDYPPGASTNNRKVAEYILPFAEKVWADAIDMKGTLPYRHDYYLKLWQLSKPRIHADFILFDEAQDANPVMVDIVSQQADHQVQLVWVGDSQQQIYSFTGAVNALSGVPADSKTYLSQSFRFGQAIADVANRCLDQLGSDLCLKGYGEIDSSVGPVDEPDAILTRTNAAAIRAVLTAQQEGRSVHLVGGGKEFAAFARGAEALQNRRPTDHPDLACFDSWGEVQRYVDEDEQGSELRLSVRLVDEFGTETILSALDNMIREDRANLVVSTAHKAKGRQWPTVKLGGDFPSDRMGGEELRLLYVAVTRAQLRLDISEVAWFQMIEQDDSLEEGDGEDLTEAMDSVVDEAGIDVSLSHDEVMRIVRALEWQADPLAESIRAKLGDPDPV